MFEEGHFTESLIEGRWELDKDSGWRGPDNVIEVVRTDDGVEFSAPRQWLDAIRAYLEWVEEGGASRGVAAEHPFQIGGDQEIPWHAKAPAWVLSAVMVPVLVYDLITGQVGHWGVSEAALAERRYETILLHMIAHGSVMHVLMNVGALLTIGPGLMMRLGRPPLSGCGSCCSSWRAG